MRLWILLLSTALAGCVSAPISAPTGEATAQDQIQGRLSVTQPNRRDTAGFGYRRIGRLQQWDFTGPAGGALGSLFISPELTRWQPSKGEPLSAQDPQVLAQQALGINLPLQHAAKWLSGQAPSLDQLDGWELSYRKWDEEMRPKILDISKDNIRVRVAIKQWQYNPN